MIVADTSLIVNFYLGEQQGQAQAVFERDPEWFTSPLWRFELHNSLLKYIRAERITIPEAELIRKKATTLINGHEHLGSTRQVFVAATQHKISAYDAEYVVLAQQLGAPLVTFDKKLVRAATGIALSPEDFLR